MYDGTDFINYVHGNFDATQLQKNDQVKLIGGSSFMKRSYFLQTSLDKSLIYEIFITNPTKTLKSIKLSMINFKNIDSPQKLIAFDLPTGGSYMYKYTPKEDPTTIMLESKLTMARPTIFASNSITFDVCHG